MNIILQENQSCEKCKIFREVKTCKIKKEAKERENNL
jgi:hypothetical protein